ncbi:hypothetical protein CHU98_g6685 [Xylaria longipes]|nr:hypothetical protein CHU98_g6685 [Xylaria longipes]
MESISNELTTTSLFDDVISLSTLISTSSEPIERRADLDKSIKEWSDETEDGCVVGWESADPGAPSEPSHDNDNNDNNDNNGDDDDDDDDEDDGIPPLIKIGFEVRKNWGNRGEASRYREAIVLLISWEKHDFGQEMEDTIKQYSWMFESLYRYEVWPFKIPAKKPHLALTSQLVELAKKDSPETLFVIWYDGHACEHMDRRGSPRWFSHRDPEKSQDVDSSVISAALGDCEADILLVNNACQSLTCDRFGSKGIVESISASAFSTLTYGSIKADDHSPSMTWAAYKILNDRKSVEEGITVAELHRKICLAVQWGSNYHPDFDEFDDREVYWNADYIRTQPVYTRLSADAPGPGGRTRSIVLGRLQFTKPFVGDIMYHEMQVNLQVRYTDNIDPKEWIDWLQSAPPCVEFVSLEEVIRKDPEKTLESWSDQ